MSNAANILEKPVLTAYHTQNQPNAVTACAVLQGAGAAAPTVYASGGVVQSVSRASAGVYTCRLNCRSGLDANDQPMTYVSLSFINNGSSTASAGWTVVTDAPADVDVSGTTAVQFSILVYDDTDAAADLPDTDWALLLNITMIAGNG